MTQSYRVSQWHTIAAFRYINEFSIPKIDEIVFLTC